MKILNLIVLLTCIIFITSCSKDEPNNPILNEYDVGLGWFGDDEISEIPTSTNFGFGDGNLPTSYNMVDKFPPIGSQGAYGTCVAWAVAYNTKTAINGMDKNLTTSDLSYPQNQFSPKDMFTALPDDQKNQDCDGTNFKYALELLQNRGVATMATVPYTSLGSCTQSSTQASWTEEANNHKIKYWRKIEASVKSIKQNISNNIPVILGARLADNFMSWNSDDVISSHSTFTSTGLHAYHAMVIAGYDDDKGANGAFRVINSWDDTWGDKGYIWIDYDFLIKEFGINSLGENSLFIAANQKGNDDTPPDDNPKPNNTGVDLASWIFDDYSTYDNTGNWNERQLNFNLYNIGQEDAKPSSNWDIYYIYFNAYDANDYGVLFYDEFNQSITAETFECPTSNNCIINTTIEANNDFAYKVFESESIIRTYYVPEITGDYYLLLVADASDVFQENDEQNNLFYTSVDPISFDEGYAFKSRKTTSKSRNEIDKSASVLSNKTHHKATNGLNKNAYTNQEILSLLKREKANGNLNQKVSEYYNRMDKSTIYHKN